MKGLCKKEARRMSEVRITKTASYLPEKAMSNAELYESVIPIQINFDAKAEQAKNPVLVSLSDVEVFNYWGDRVTGIKERRYADSAKGETTEGMAVNVGKKILKDSQLDPQELDMIYIGTFSPYNTLPTIGETVGDLIGARGVPAMWTCNACSSFLFNSMLAYTGIKSGIHENVLVINSETLSKLGNAKDPKTFVLWGDGAGGALFQASDKPGFLTPPYLESFLGDTIILENPLMQIPLEQAIYAKMCERAYVKMRGENVFRDATTAFMRGTLGALLYHKLGYKEGKAYMREHYAELEKGKTIAEEFESKRFGLDKLVEKLIEHNGLVIVLHQAKDRIDRKSMKSLGIPYERCYVTIDRYGNNSGASTPIGLDQAIHEGILKQGQAYMLVAVGADYSAGGVLGIL